MELNMQKVIFTTVVGAAAKTALGEMDFSVVVGLEALD
jgi:hypothetical protein